MERAWLGSRVFRDLFGDPLFPCARFIRLKQRPITYSILLIVLPDTALPLCRWALQAIHTCAPFCTHSMTDEKVWQCGTCGISAALQSIKDCADCNDCLSAESKEHGEWSSKYCGRCGRAVSSEGHLSCNLCASHLAKMPKVEEVENWRPECCSRCGRKAFKEGIKECQLCKEILDAHTTISEETTRTSTNCSRCSRPVTDLTTRSELLTNKQSSSMPRA
jgi:hypothetical protein